MYLNLLNNATSRFCWMETWNITYLDKLQDLHLDKHKNYLLVRATNILNSFGYTNTSKYQQVTLQVQTQSTTDTLLAALTSC